MGDDTDSISGDPLDWFAQRLRDLRTAAGGPSLRDLVGLTKAIGRPYRLSTIQAKLAGTSRPDWEFVEAFVLACAQAQGRPGVGEDAADLRESLQAWHADHLRLLRALAAERQGRRRAAEAEAEL